MKDQYWEEDDCNMAVPYPDLQKRTGKRMPGIDELPWTMTDGTTLTSPEDQSSVVYLAGFFVTHCSASSARRMTCNSRKDMFFAGWDELSSTLFLVRCCSKGWQANRRRNQKAI